MLGAVSGVVDGTLNGNCFLARLFHQASRLYEGNSSITAERRNTVSETTGQTPDETTTLTFFRKSNA